ncbi:6-beta-glucosidase [Hexamita inflata]|uniref:6-beta-glucosidase n=1 Tax=Hexamita inflata TaxID=28002 RepID=A0AA86QJ69_9EUKA|nr:6-beta-glucosidase [Hexamita inflata]CAI9960464.1 6-beta-glucosidase [Hexamita inflata]
MFSAIVLQVFMTEVEVYATTADFSLNLTKMPSVQLEAKEGRVPSITVDKATKYQEVDGFGASITDGAAWLLSEKLTDQQLQETMEQLFDREKGIALSFLRQPIGGTDLSTKFFSYDDLCNQTDIACTTPRGVEDKELKRFSISHDRQYIIPMVKKALALNPDMKVMMSPWSPPGWMKSSGNMIGWDHVNNNESVLLPEYYDAHANYIRKAIQAYEAEGISVYAMTIQNEPKYVPPTYCGMSMESVDQALYIKKFLAPVFKKANISTKIMINDFNWDWTDYTEDIYKDAEVSKLIIGSSWHHYGGEPTSMSMLKQKYPQMDNWVTEASSQLNTKANSMKATAVELIDVMRNYGRSYIKWGLAMDQNYQPHTGGCSDCIGIVTVNGSDYQNIVVQKTFDYYALGQASKFIYKNAVRIDSNEDGPVHNVAFLNTDGSVVLYTYNQDKVDQKIVVKVGAKSFEATVKAEAITTFVWKSDKMSTGALVGIICGSVAGVAAVIIFVVCCIKFKWCQKKHSEERTQFIDNEINK